MWRFFDKKILFESDDTDVFEFIPLQINICTFSGEILTLPTSLGEYSGYDNWRENFPENDEVHMIEKAIYAADHNPHYRAHIRGISLAQSCEMLREHYRSRGYEDILAKHYTLPEDVQITSSISLRHALWCEKDKKFLSQKSSLGTPYGMISPPIRGSHDLRVLQQALRMNIIMGIEVFPGDNIWFKRLLDEEILPPFSLAQMIRFRWLRYGWKPLQSYTI